MGGAVGVPTPAVDFECFWLNFGAKLASKTHPKSHSFFDRIFDGFVMDFWLISIPKSIKNHSKNNQQIIQTAQQPKIKNV